MTVLGLLLGAFGLVLLNFGNAPATSNAGTEPYTSDWQATKILTVGAMVGNTFTFEAGIGVWEWEVNGTFDTTTTYKETWTAPNISNVRFLIENPDVGCSPLNIDPLLFLAGCWSQQKYIDGVNTKNYLFQIRGVTDPELIGHRFKVNEGGGEQRTNSCISAPRNIPSESECIIQSGSYNFQHIYEPGNDDRGRWLGGGTLTPLQWHVEGEIRTQ